MKKTFLLLAVLALARVATAQNNEAWLALGKGDSDLTFPEMQIDGKTILIHGIDVDSDFPTDSLAMEEAFHWIKRHYFNAVRLLAPQPPLFHELSERYRFHLLDSEQTEPFPWIWRPGIPDDILILYNFSPFGTIDITNMLCKECTKEIVVTLKRDFEWPDGAIAVVYGVRPWGVREKTNGTIPLKHFATGESVTFTLTLSPEWGIYTSYETSLEVLEPFDGFRKGDHLLPTTKYMVTN
jgi:hypothetical protein